ncbi:hypothetical protein H1R20_g8392, partial [Candolleomyces eurysporus]
MSSYADVVASESLKRVELNFQYCSLTVLFYDYLLTLRDEIEYVWKQKWRNSTCLYVLCRYALVANVLYVLSVSQTTGMRLRYWIYDMRCPERVWAYWYLRMKVNSLRETIPSIVNTRIKILTYINKRLHSRIRGVLSALVVTFEVTAFLLASVRLWSSFKYNLELHGSVAMRRKALHSVVFRQGFWYIFAIVGLSVASVILNFKAWKGGFVQRLLNSLKVP